MKSSLKARICGFCAGLMLCASGCAPRVPPVSQTPSGLPLRQETTTAHQANVVDASRSARDATTPEATDGQVAGRTPSSPLLQTVDSVTQRMVQIRGLRQREPINAGVLSRDEILLRLRARIAEEYHDDELAREGALNRAIGLWADPRDYVSTSFELLEEQVAGFYDPTRRQLFLASWLSAEEQAPTLAHELTHALQDQHFQIGRFVHHERMRGDAQLAAMSVVEGDATLAMIASVTPPGMFVSAARIAVTSMDRAPQGERLARAPLVLRETLMFPYRDGLQLCTAAYERGGWAAINELLQHPPASTEQVLHPEKLAAHEAPLTVGLTVPPALAATHELSYEETMGELGVRLWLQTWIDRGLAEEASEGWGGDHAMILTPRNANAAQRLEHPIGIWKIVVDPSPRDTQARELERAAVEALRLRYTRSPLTTLRRASIAIIPRNSQTISFVARRNSTVVLVVGIAPTMAAQVLQQVFE